MNSVKEIGDVINAIALTLVGVQEVREDGDVDLLEVGILGASVLPSFIRAVKGFKQIPRELKTLDKDEVDYLIYGFLTTMKWDPSDDARDKFAIIYDMAANLITNTVRWLNTVNPPKAEIVS